MTGENLIHELSRRFGEHGDFAEDTALLVVDGNAEEALYDLAVGKTDPALNKIQNEQVVFRSAYVLEKIFFDHPHIFRQFRERFFADFPDTENESAKRHFTKIMAHLLPEYKPDGATCTRIAEACAEWLAEPQTRVAVKVYAMEVLLLLGNEVEWLPEMLPELVEIVKKHTSPAILSRLKRWKLKGTV